MNTRKNENGEPRVEGEWDEMGVHHPKGDTSLGGGGWRSTEALLSVYRLPPWRYTANRVAVDREGRLGRPTPPLSVDRDECGGIPISMGVK